MIELLLLLLAGFCIVACGVFVAAEFAFITLNRSKVEREAARGDAAAAGVVTALTSLSTQLSGAQVGITITNLAIGYLAEPTIASMVRPGLVAMGLGDVAVHGVGVVIAISVATLATMLFGELIPKNMALAQPITTAKWVQRPQRWFTHVMRGPIRGLNAGAEAILRRFGVEPQEELASARSADELLSLVKRSAEKGTLPRETALLVERSLSYGEYAASDIMTPRVKVDSLHPDDSVADALVRVRETGHSRFPVITDSLDDAMGMVHTKLLIKVPYGKRAKTPVSDIMERPVVVPESIPLDALFDELSESRTSTQMAIVIDEFGGADGIVTIEDMIEEIVGDVDDEHDRPELDIRRQKPGQWLVSGLLRIDEITEELGLALPDEEDFDTIAGLIIDRLEHMPRVRESVVVTAIDRGGAEVDIKLTVVKMDGHRIDQVQLRRQRRHKERA